MKPLFLVLALLASCVAGLNSGIYGDQESTEPRSAGKIEEVSVPGLAESFVPTPTKRLSNAERLRRRLPLLPPRRRSGPLVPRASCVPCTTYTGRIDVRTVSSGSSLGYHATWHAGVKFLSGVEPDMIFELTKGQTDEAVEMTATNMDGSWSTPSRPFHGAVSSQTPQAGVHSVASFGGVDHTPPKSFSANGESTIWLFDAVTKEIRVQWTNPDGTQYAPTIAYDIRANRLFLVGAIDSYNAASTFPASAVAFYLDVISSQLEPCSG